MQSQLCMKSGLNFLAMPAILMASTLAFAAGPVAEVNVSLEETSRGKKLTVKTDESGMFVFDNLKAGTYVLHLGKAGKGAPAKAVNDQDPVMDVHDNVEADIVIRSAVMPQKTDGIAIKISGTSGGRVTGQVIMEEDEPARDDSEQEERMETAH